jgi:hypothetical protein
MPTIAEQVAAKMGDNQQTLTSPSGEPIVRVMLNVLADVYGTDASVLRPEEKPIMYLTSEERKELDGVTKKWVFPDSSVIVTNSIDIPEEVYWDFGFRRCWCRRQKFKPECGESHS